MGVVHHDIVGDVGIDGCCQGVASGIHKDSSTVADNIVVGDG